MSEITERLEQRITDLAGEGMTHLQQVNGHAPLGGPDPECGNCDSIYGELYILRDALAELRTLQQQLDLQKQFTTGAEKEFLNCKAQLAALSAEREPEKP